MLPEGLPRAPVDQFLGDLVQDYPKILLSLGVLVVLRPYLPNTVELMFTLGALSPRGGPVQDPFLTVVAFWAARNRTTSSAKHQNCEMAWRDHTIPEQVPRHP